MPETVVVKPAVRQRFERFLSHGRILFFSAPCGFGKTALAETLLSGQKVLRCSAADPEFSLSALPEDWDILLLDDLQQLQEESDAPALCELIRSRPERRFVLLSRGAPPGPLAAFQYTGLMTVLEAEDLRFDREDIRRLFSLRGLSPTESELSGIFRESGGYPLGVAIAAHGMSGGKPFGPELAARVFREIFCYFESAVYRRFDLPLRRFLLELAPFERFDLEMARMVSGDPQTAARLAWLDISLPQRGVEGLTETIPAVFRLLTNKEVSLPSFSVTSALPSIMNGGKDFSLWSKKDDLLYQTLRIPVEAVLGKDGVGLADCAIAESKFEKGEDISGRMLSLIPRMNDIRQHGTPDMEFAAGGLLARSQLAGGQSEDARRTVRSLRESFAAEGRERFLPNMDAMLCRIALHAGDLDASDAWYRKSAPRDPLRVNVMKRYLYFTQAMVELADGAPDKALLTLAPLARYIQSCRRHIDGIHLDLLTAIARFRSRDETWRQDLTHGLNTAAEFCFIRPVSVYGAAILPLLEELEWHGSVKWHKRLMADVRGQAAYYPRFLQPRLAPKDALTPTEVQILRLLCADKSNAEIGQIMDIKLPTVKTHVSHILDKLDVRRRSEAKTAAKRLRLVPEDL